MKFVCPECSKSNHGHVWDKQLEHNFGNTAWPIESYMKNHCVYTCPACGKTVHGRDIKDVYGKR